ncbi:MAG: chloride channel protein [Chloroflexi bacterium]|nr:chloride channel protein [Chloroflexota bacterium]MCC6892959.1 chloride channel protein [Anaerolineae bacterium]
MWSRMNLGEHRAFVGMLVKWVVLGSAVGVLSGTASAVFLVALNWATAVRVANPALLFLLPLAGLVIGWSYYRMGGSAARGNNLVIEQVHLNKDPIPLRMAPMVLIGTVLTHLFGGSAGREGTAIQMGSSLADGLRRVLRLEGEDRRLMVLAGISGGFGSVFGTPIAGFVFALEAPAMGRIRYDAVVPCLTAALVGDMVTRAWGVGHSHYPALAEIGIQPLLLGAVVLAGIIFGWVALVFVELLEYIRHLSRKLIVYPPLRPVVGGVIVIGLTVILGKQDYLGLSLSLIQNTMNGTGVEPLAFVLKVVFTAVTLGTGFMGGEVTPLFVMGATAGYSVGRVLGIEPAFMAALGFVAVFAGASNTPLACTLMAVELFGGGSLLYVGVACFVAYLASGHRGIYVTQRIATPKTAGDVVAEESIEARAKRRSRD